MKLDQKTKELIAVGASVAAHCRPCLEHHTKKALEYGSDAEEIAEAVETGKRVGKVAAAGRPANLPSTGCCP